MDRRFAATVGTLSAAVLLTTGCAGGIGKGEAQDTGEGAEYGATKAEFQEALADMTPVTLKYQAGSSASGHAAKREQAFADAVEEWSGGKVTLEVV